MATLKQVHSATALFADRPGLAGEGDALVSSSSGVAVSIRTADCYPILLVDGKNRAVAAVHAGWRGTAAHIVEAALAEMHRSAGTRAEDLFAAVGPGIGACCYVVGGDVAEKFGQLAGKLDLAAANRAQLLRLGVPEVQIEILGGCTFCDAEQFHSYRREKAHAGRMISFIRIV